MRVELMQLRALTSNANDFVIILWAFYNVLPPVPYHGGRDFQRARSQFSYNRSLRFSPFPFFDFETADRGRDLKSPQIYLCDRGLILIWRSVVDLNSECLMSDQGLRLNAFELIMPI